MDYCDLQVIAQCMGWKTEDGGVTHTHVSGGERHPLIQAKGFSPIYSRYFYKSFASFSPNTSGELFPDRRNRP